MNKQFLMLKLIYEFNRLAGEAIANYADLDDILACSCKEMIGRAKYIPEENMSAFDEIFKTMNGELKALAPGRQRRCLRNIRRSAKWSAP